MFRFNVGNGRMEDFMKASKQEKVIAAITSGVVILAAATLFVTGLSKDDKTSEKIVAEQETTVQMVESNVADATANILSLESINAELVGSANPGIGAEKEEADDVVEAESETAKAEEQTKAEKKETKKSETEKTETKKTKTEKETEESDKLFLVDTDYYINVRKEPSEDSDIISLIGHAGGGTVLEYGDVYTKIKSGSITGYVATDCIWTGKNAQWAMYELGIVKATIKDGEAIAKEGPAKAYTDAFILSEGTEVKVYPSEGKWAKIEYSGQVAFVKLSQLDIRCDYQKALTKKQMKAVIKKAEEEQRAMAEAAIADAQAETQEYSQWSGESQTETVQTSAYGLSGEDAYLLACVVTAEAGSESYEGQLAVANIVLNRLKSGVYGSTISDVIYAPGQFAVVTNGAMASAIANGPWSTAVQAANDALAGKNNVPQYNSFCAIRSAHYESYAEYSVICNQVFYRR